jgi:hypoxanthine-DNA glycosylase
MIRKLAVTAAVGATRHTSFPPVVRRGAHVLILGSMPGAASLAAREYYAHPQNQFWTIIERIFGVLRTLPYAARLDGLTANRIALWDVLESCVRPGSLDAAIEHTSAVPNALTGLLRAHPGIRRLCCNGATSYRAVQRYFGAELARDFPRLECLRLPSTSPAHAGMRLEAKVASWRQALGPTARRLRVRDE